MHRATLWLQPILVDIHSTRDPWHIGRTRRTSSLRQITVSNPCRVTPKTCFKTTAAMSRTGSLVISPGRVSHECSLWPEMTLNTRSALSLAEPLSPRTDTLAMHPCLRSQSRRPAELLRSANVAGARTSRRTEECGSPRLLLRETMLQSGRRPFANSLTSALRVRIPAKIITRSEGKRTLDAIQVAAHQCTRLTFGKLRRSALLYLGESDSSFTKTS